VQQDQIQIRVRRQLLATQSPDRHQGQPGPVRELPAQPIVVRVGELEAKLDTDKSGPTEYVGPDLVQ